MAVAGAVLGQSTDSTPVLSLYPQNDPRSLRFSLFKDFTHPTPRLMCWSVFPSV